MTNMRHKSANSVILQGINEAFFVIIRNFERKLVRWDARDLVPGGANGHANSVDRAPRRRREIRNILAPSAGRCATERPRLSHSDACIWYGARIPRPLSTKDVAAWTRLGGGIGAR